MGTAEGEYDAARLLLVMTNEDLEYLRQALLETPDDARLAAAVTKQEHMRLAYIELVAETLIRLERERGAKG